MGKNWPLSLATFIMFIALLQAPVLAESPNVGGRVLLKNSHDRAVIIPVRLRGIGNRVGTSGVVYTGLDGWYYLYRVPAGHYVLEVLAAKANGEWLIIFTGPEFPVQPSGFTRAPDATVP